MNVYLSSTEQKLLRQLSEELGVTQAYVLRLCFRLMVDLPLPADAEEMIPALLSGHVRRSTVVR